LSGINTSVINMATIADIDHAPTVSSAFRAVCFFIASPRQSN